jgi:hypothetical protein
MKLTLLLCLASLISFQAQSQTYSAKIPAAVFKAQEYCRAEVERFEFNAPFSIVSAVVYFSGANFQNTQKAVINGSSLKSIKHLMDRCGPGSIVIFDEVKVIGPDKLLRTITGLSLMLI